MARTRLPNIDEDGNFLDPEVLARLTEKYGAVAGEGTPAITANTTLDEATALGAQTNGA